MGRWHFVDNTLSGQSKEKSHIIDEEKDKLAILHNILPIRINCEKNRFRIYKI